MNNKKYLGIIFSISAAVLWGISGNLAEYIFRNSPLTTITVICFRMLFSGIILLIYGIHSFNVDILSILKNKKVMKRIFIYSIFGIVTLQTTFFQTIKVSNAPFAALMQFLSPLIIIIYYSYKNKVPPKFNEVMLSVIALFGMYLMMTNGNIYNLKVSLIAMFWGLLSAFSFVFYIVYIKKLFHIPTTIVIGLGMIIGSIVLMPFVEYNTVSHFFRIDILSVFMGTVIFGTVISFYLFLESVRYIEPKISSSLSAFEPLSTLIIGVIFMNVHLGAYQILGAVLIITSVTILSLKYN